MTESAPDNPNAKLECAKMLLDEWKTRHQHCWHSLQIYGLAAITVAIVPYLRKEFYQELGSAVLIFPAVAWMLALAAAWLFTAEYLKCRPVEQKYHELLGDFRPETFVAQRLWQKPFKSRVGVTTVLIFVIGFTILSIVNGCILWKLAHTPEVPPTNQTNENKAPVTK